MASQVIKKDGTKQDFDPGKIRKAIGLAVEQAGLSDERKNEVVEQVATAVIQLADTKEEIATSEIREKILSDLDDMEPKVSESWRGYSK